MKMYCVLFIIGSLFMAPNLSFGQVLNWGGTGVPSTQISASRDRASVRGVSSGGGGHWFESNFKAKAQKILAGLQVMFPAAKQKLKFDPDLLIANLAYTGRVNPKCAEPGIELDYLVKTKGKKAYVGAPMVGRNVILLDCSDRSEWEKKFNSMADGDTLFFIHELIRNNDLNDEAENDLTVSYSFIAAKSTNDVLFNESLLRLLSNGKNGLSSQGDSCTLDVTEHTKKGEGLFDSPTRYTLTNLYVTRGGVTETVYTGHQGELRNSTLETLLYPFEEFSAARRNELQKRIIDFKCSQ